MGALPTWKRVQVVSLETHRFEDKVAKTPRQKKKLSDQVFVCLFVFCLNSTEQHPCGQLGIDVNGYICCTGSDWDGANFPAAAHISVVFWYL